MTLSVYLQLASVLSGLVGIACAIYVAVRTGRWRESDEAKELGTRIETVEQKVIRIEERLSAMPTKADLEGLKSDVRAIGREVGKVDDSVTRIESWLMERGK